MRQTYPVSIPFIETASSTAWRASTFLRNAAFVALILLAWLAVAFPVVAQNVQHSKNSQDLGLRHDFTVDPVSLSLNIQITLGSYNGRGGSSLPVAMRYSSKLWRVDYDGYYVGGPQGFPDDNNYTRLNAVYGDPDHDRMTPGWSSTLELPYVITTPPEWFDSSGNPCDYDKCGEGSVPDRHYIRRIRLRMPDGSTHEMRVDDNIYYYTQQPTYPLTYYAVDGSRIRYVETGDINSNTAQAIIYLPDGSRYVTTGNGWGGGQYIDRNGNTLTYNGTTGVWTDSLGRSISLASMPGYNNTTINYTYTYRQLKVEGQPEQSALTVYNQPLAYYGPGGWFGAQPTYPALFDSSSGADKIGSGGIFNPGVLYQIEAPDGSKYTFTYNIYGEIDKVVYPTGGYERFEYAPVPGITAMNAPYTLTNRGVVRRWVSPDGTHASEQEWQYGAVEVSQSVLKTFVVAPDGTVTERHIHRGRLPGAKPFDFDDAKSGMIFEECVYAPGAQHGQKGQMLRRKLTERGMSQYVKQGGGISGGFVVTRDPKVTKEVEILLDTGGDALTSMTTYDYDADQNLIAISRYDYVALNSYNAQTWAITTMPQGELLRTDEATFLVNDPNIDAGTRDAYRARNLLSLPTSTRVKNAQGTIVAQSAMRYDEVSYPLLTYGMVTGWNDPQTNVRGNVTTIGKWLDATNSYIETHAQYDQCGNVRYSWDAKDNKSEMIYTDSFSTGGSRNTFAYPTTTKSPIPDSNGGTGSNSALETNSQYDFSTGLVTSTTDANGQVTSFSYNDPLNRLKTVTRPTGGGSTTYEYGNTPNSFYVRVQTALDSSRSLDTYQYFDGLGRATRSLSYDGDATLSWIAADTQYDQMGRVKTVSNPYRVSSPSASISPCGTCTTTEYDDLGRVNTVITPDGAQFVTAYGASTTNAVGTTIIVTDQAGKKRKSLTDAMGRLIQVIEDPSGLNYQTSYNYDVLGNLRTVTQGGQTRTFIYDSFSRLTSATNPESGTATYHYDNNSNLDWKTDARGVKTSYEYDALNRVKTRSHSLTGATPTNYVAAPDVNYFYDGKGMPANMATPSFPKGKLTAVKSSVSETIYTEFDAVGNIKKHRQISEPGTSNEQTYLMEYSYNLAGNLTSQKYPSGKIVETEYDAAGRVAGVKNPTGGYYAGAAPTDNTNRIQYAAHGAVTDMKLGNGLWEHVNFNNRLQPTEIGLGTQKSSNDRLKLAYNYGTTNNNGNIQSQTITVPTVNNVQGTTLTQTYSYDQLNRLQSASETGGANPWTQSYTYANPDGSGGQFGNRRVDAANTTQALIPASNPTFNMSNNKFAANQNYDYDAVGNVKNAPGFAYSYDSENRMVIANDGQAGGISNYSYDGDGRRVKKTTGSGGATTIFVYNVMGQMVAEYDNSGQQGSGGTSYLTTDNLGTPRVITDASDAVKARHDYLPFGEELQAGTGGRTTAQGYSQPDGVRQRLTSKERDDETGLDYFGARYYASAQGRFTSPDPLMASAHASNPQTWNRYTYVLNNPLAYIDPDGMDSEKITKREYEFTATQYVNNKNDGEIAYQVKVSVTETIYERTDDNGNVSTVTLAEASAVNTGNGRLNLSDVKLGIIGTVTASIVEVSAAKGFDKTITLGIAAEETLLGVGAASGTNKGAAAKASKINPLQASGGTGVATGDDYNDRRANIGKAIDKYNAFSKYPSVNGDYDKTLLKYAGKVNADRIPVIKRNIDDVRSGINSSNRERVVYSGPSSIRPH